MTVTQFRTLFVASCLVVLFLLLQAIFATLSQREQTLALRAQQVVTDGRNSQIELRQLATRIYQVSQQTQDQGLKDLLVRERVTVAPPASAAPATAPAPTTR